MSDIMLYSLSYYIIAMLIFGVLTCYFGYKLFNPKKKHPLLGFLAGLVISLLFFWVASEIIGVYVNIYLRLYIVIVWACICACIAVKYHFFAMFLYVWMMYFPVIMILNFRIYPISMELCFVLAVIAGVITAFIGGRILLIITSAVLGGHFLGIFVSLKNITESYEYMYSLIYSVPFILSGLYVQLRYNPADTKSAIEEDSSLQTRQL